MTDLDGQHHFSKYHETQLGENYESVMDSGAHTDNKDAGVTRVEVLVKPGQDLSKSMDQVARRKASTSSSRPKKTRSISKENRPEWGVNKPAKTAVRKSTEIGRVPRKRSVSTGQAKPTKPRSTSTGKVKPTGLYEPPKIVLSN